ncbi:MAG: YciI family protein [Aulosira sp. DedQUE10]|nr:YciI family protein [Aulosira sp. DedQUE10]
MIKNFLARCRFERSPFDLITKGNKGGNPMKYVLLIYLEENALSETEREDCYVKSAQLAQQLNSKGQYLATAPLHPIATATSIRVRDGKPLVTDGPFAETREQLGGFFLIDAQDLDAAIAIAAQIPAAQVGTVEIRPVIEVAGLPEY